MGLVASPMSSLPAFRARLIPTPTSFSTTAFESGSVTARDEVSEVADIAFSRRDRQLERRSILIVLGLQSY